MKSSENRSSYQNHSRLPNILFSFVFFLPISVNCDKLIHIASVEIHFLPAPQKIGECKWRSASSGQYTPKENHVFPPVLKLYMLLGRKHVKKKHITQALESLRPPHCFGAFSF